MEQKKDERMMSLLDSFLEGHDGQLFAMGELGAVPVDYVESYLKTAPVTETAADSAIRSKTELLLDAFLSSEYKRPSFDLSAGSTFADETESVDDEPKELEDAYYTQTLARIYLKQRRYDKALEIIKSLYLNFPNKSIYFADQIRYLEKLVRINKKTK